MGIEKIKEIKVENGRRAVSFTGHANTNRAYLSQPNDSVNFTGMAMADFNKVMSNSLNPKQKIAIAMMKSWEWLKGELGGILITAIGTGLVAPVFIGFNPFVKAPKDATPDQKREVVNTKLYTAMRQPISACLAILFQASIQKYIDKGLDLVFNNPDHSKKQRLNTDQSVLNTDTYIKGLVKDEMKQAGVKKPSFLKGLFSKSARVERGMYNEAFDMRVKEKQAEQLKGLVDDFVRTNKITVNTKYGRVVDNETMAELINKQIDAYQKDAKDLMKKKEQITYYARKSEILVPNEAFFKDLAKELPLEEIEINQFKEILAGSLSIEDIKAAKSEKVKETLLAEAKEKLAQKLVEVGEKNPEKKAIVQDLIDHPDQLLEKCESMSKESKGNLEILYKQVTDRVGELYESVTDPGVKEELKRILDKPEDLRGHGISRIVQRIESIKAMCKKRGGYTRANYIDAMLEKDTVLRTRIVELESCRITDPKSADASVVKETIRKIAKALHFDKARQPEVASILQDTNTFSGNFEKLTKKIYEDIGSAFKDLLKHSYKSVNQVTKVAVGALITLPITCTALNWLYPRIMELFFPKLAGVKKAQAQAQAQKDGGDK